jgi:hypothetical protein
MTKLRKLALLATAGLTTGVLIACGGGDSGGGSSGNPDTPETSVPEGGTTDAPNPPPPGDGGTDGPVVPDTFPQYVKTLIETKTTENGTPDLEAVWGTLVDDDKFVFPVTFFP